MTIRVAIIGAGYGLICQLILPSLISYSPGGLATLKTLLEASTPDQQIEACLFEAYVARSLFFARTTFSNLQSIASPMSVVHSTIARTRTPNW
jgi:dimethylaniline monooxygenase (N-oxide forming)